MLDCHKFTQITALVTVVTEMAEKGYQMEDIMGVTGHKRTDSVQRYIKRITPTKKMKISNDLSERLHGSTSITQSFSLETRDEVRTNTVYSVHSAEDDKPTAVLEKNGATLKFYL